MAQQTFQGNWNQIKGKIKEKWGKLTDDEITECEGKFDQLVGKLQEKYGYDQERAQREIKDFEKQCSGNCGTGVNQNAQQNKQFNQGNQGNKVQGSNVNQSKTNVGTHPNQNAQGQQFKTNVGGQEKNFK